MIFDDNFYFDPCALDWLAINTMDNKADEPVWPVENVKSKTRAEVVWNMELEKQSIGGV